jgi:putative ABC transport system permease protein
VDLAARAQREQAHEVIVAGDHRAVDTERGAHLEQAGNLDFAVVDLGDHALADYLPDDVLVLTKPQFVQREKEYWNSATPIGYIFAFGAIMGFVVGAIIVYQILFADVSEHLNEYATLRAIGFRNGFVSGIVLQEAAILAVLGYLPGLAIVWWLYGKAAAATNLPLYVTQERAVTVFLMTLAMCAISALMAVRKVRRLDPAEVF